MQRNLIRQFEQVKGTHSFSYDMYQQCAEKAGRHYYTGELATISGSFTVVDATNVFKSDEVGNFIVIDAGEVSGVYKIVSCDDGNSADVFPEFSGTHESINYRRHYHQNLEDDLNYLRKMLLLITGEDSWYSDPSTNLHNMSYLIPKRPNFLGESNQYPQRSGAVYYDISNIGQTGIVSQGNPAEYYIDNVTDTDAGKVLRFTNDNTMGIAVNGGFYPADSGYLRVYKDGLLIGELDLSAAWIADGCEYEQSESDVGNNPGHTPAGGLDIFTLTGRRCMNNSVDSFGYFWPAYQMASMNCVIQLSEGFNGVISLQHSSGGNAQNYIYSSFWVDTSNQTITAAAPVVTSGTEVLKYLSGVPYYNTGTQFNIFGTNSDALFEEGYRSNSSMTFYLDQFNTSNISPTYTELGLSEPLSITDTIDSVGGYNTDFIVGGGNFRNLDARAYVTYRNVFTSAQSANSAPGVFRIDTYGTTSTNLIEYFDDEHKRYKGTEDFTNISIGNNHDVDSEWVESDNALLVNGLVVYNGSLVYPTINNTLYKPAGPDYSGASGDFYYYRVFIASSAFTQGTLTFTGWSNALSIIQSSNVDVHLRYPNCNDYGNNNTDVWQDLSVDQQSYGSNGCLGAGSSNSIVVFNFGTTSSSSYGNRIIVRIRFGSNVAALNALAFNPIL